MADDFTVGVEEEYQLVDARTGTLRSRARDVLETDWSAEIHPEIQQTMLEIGTRICASVAEVEREIHRLRLQAASTASAEGLQIVAAGVHPFSRWEGQAQTAGERYQRVLDRYGRVMRTEHIFGMHVHVAVPERIDRIQVLNAVQRYIPHLLALSCSSPFYEGEDTGYASYRTILARRLPHTGPVPRFASETEYRRFVDLLLRSGATEDEWTLYWTVRPHPTYPTLEFRGPDACPRADDAVAIAALIRTLAAAAAEGRIRECPDLLSESATHALLASNEWQAARFGLDATLVDPGTKRGRQPVREAIRALIEHLHPTAEALGDAAALAHLETLLERGNGADRMREMRPGAGELRCLVEWLSKESLLGTGLDRRESQRGT